MTDTGAEITVYQEMPHRLRRDLWDMYQGAFLPLRHLAAQRHVMFHDEYIDLMDDPRVDKIITRRGDTPLGLACVTNDLKAIPLIEPEYFRAREPKLYDTGHIWYVPFVCERQGHPKPPSDNFRLLIDKVAEPIRPVRGACFMDYSMCRLNWGLPDKANDLLTLTDQAAECEQVDAQTYWVYYPGGRPL